MQDMVPGLAMEEFSTPPSSPVLVTRTIRKTTVSTADSVNFTTTKDSSNDSHDMQLGELINSFLHKENHSAIMRLAFVWHDTYTVLRSCNYTIMN